MTAPPAGPGGRLRAELRRAILSGDWPPGYRLPSENDLAQRHNCSRMTANKVLTGLVQAGMITRRRRAGSFVATPRTEQAMLEIGDFAADAARLGQPYAFEILSRVVGRREDGLEAVHVICRHLAGDTPLAHEERDILLASVPRARDECFTDLAPSAWLLREKPWTEAEHVLRACNADAGLARCLHIPEGAACMKLERRTWHDGGLVTEVCLTYPGERHRFVGRFGAGQSVPARGDAIRL